MHLQAPHNHTSNNLQITSQQSCLNLRIAGASCLLTQQIIKTQELTNNNASYVPWQYIIRSFRYEIGTFPPRSQLEGLNHHNAYETPQCYKQVCQPAGTLLLLLTWQNTETPKA